MTVFTGLAQFLLRQTKCTELNTERNVYIKLMKGKALKPKQHSRICIKFKLCLTFSYYVFKK